jgi:hypothetical protein
MTSNDMVSLQMLRRYHFNELSGEERARVEAELEKQPDARARLERMRAAETSFLQQVDLASESVAILEKLDRPQESWFRRLLVGRPLQLAVAIVLLVALIPLGRALLVDEPTHNRTKGSAQLEMFVKDEAGVRKGNDGMILRSGDQIQFRYRAVGRRYLFVVSVDSRGVISPLYPDTRSASIEVRPDGLHTLEGSVILDDAVGPERIFAVFSDEPVSYGKIEEAVAKKRERDPRRLQRLDLQEEDVDQATILFIKE